MPGTRIQHSLYKSVASMQDTAFAPISTTARFDLLKLGDTRLLDWISTQQNIVICLAYIDPEQEMQLYVEENVWQDG